MTGKTSSASSSREGRSMNLRKSYVALFPAIVAAMVACLLLATYRSWAGPERRAYDARVQFLEIVSDGRPHGSGRVVLVGIDEKTLMREKPILFIYPDIGRFLTMMSEYRAAAIALDIIPLHRQAEKLKAGIVGINDEGSSGRLGDMMEEIGRTLDDSLLRPLLAVGNSIPIVQAYQGHVVPYYYGVIPFMGKLSLGDALLTDATVMGSDGVVRNQYMKIEGRLSFAAVISRVMTGREPDEKMVRLNYHVAKSIPFYRFSDVVERKIGVDEFSGKTVILGYLSDYEDMFPTPLNRGRKPSTGKGGITEETAERRLPGLVIQGVIVETLLAGTSLKELHTAFQVGTLLLLVSVSVLACTGFTPLRAIASVIGISLLFLAANVTAFSVGYIIHLFPQILSPLLALTFIYPYRFFVEERGRRKVRKMFGYYVDDEIIDSLLERDPTRLLEGERKDVSILFLDIRDFTRLSTRQSAETIVRFLNLYFGKVTEIVRANQGFVNKFMGDGILAFFATGENPVANVVRASLAILRETEAMAVTEVVRQLVGDWDLRVGIGIHYGKVVMGNVGSEKKMDFTIIGEGVNIASRIEGLTKQLGKRILLSEEAYEMTKGQFTFERLGEFSVKGIDRPLALYTTAGMQTLEVSRERID